MWGVQSHAAHIGRPDVDRKGEHHYSWRMVEVGTPHYATSLSQEHVSECLHTSNPPPSIPPLLIDLSFLLSAINSWLLYAPLSCPRALSCRLPAVPFSRTPIYSSELPPADHSPIRPCVPSFVLPYGSAPSPSIDYVATSCPNGHMGLPLNESSGRQTNRRLRHRINA